LHNLPPGILKNKKWPLISIAAETSGRSERLIVQIDERPCSLFRCAFGDGVTASHYFLQSKIAPIHIKRFYQYFQRDSILRKSRRRRGNVNPVDKMWRRTTVKPGWLGLHTIVNEVYNRQLCLRRLTAEQRKKGGLLSVIASVSTKMRKKYQKNKKGAAVKRRLSQNG